MLKKSSLAGLEQNMPWMENVSLHKVKLADPQGRFPLSISRPHNENLNQPLIVRPTTIKHQNSQRMGRLGGEERGGTERM